MWNGKLTAVFTRALIAAPNRQSREVPECPAYSNLDIWN
jgi:hypothetical protein